MFSIALGLAMVVFRKRLMAYYVRANERWWSAKFVGDPRGPELLIVVVGIGFVVLGVMDVLQAR